ncbi:flavin reductase family protein [Lichenicoccus sp.]|uniref:flavin reductase family protein n=1 Tax=Lichenicoccus sp. TaxID=2781899 RepID=UPI003D1091D3
MDSTIRRIFETAAMHSYEPADGHGLRHDPFNAIVGPRPIGWIASRSGTGILNLAPYSFFNAFNYTPPIIGFASTGWKHSAANIAATGEFVWNLATRSLAEAMNASAASVPPESDEFALAGLTPVPSRLVDVPRVGESPVAFECRLLQQFQLHDLKGEAVQTWLTLGQVVAVHINRSLIRDGIYDTAAAHPILRGGGPTAYIEVEPGAFFHMTRPQ